MSLPPFAIEAVETAPVSYTHLDVYKRQVRLARAAHGENLAVEVLALEFGTPLDSEVVFGGQMGLSLRVHGAASMVQLPAIIVPQTKPLPISRPWKHVVQVTLIVENRGKKFLVSFN